MAVRHEPAGGQLAYTLVGFLAGYLMPTRNPIAATTGYISVAPAHRGPGYADDLLAAGAAAIHADMGVRNAPMGRAATRRIGPVRHAARGGY